MLSYDTRVLRLDGDSWLACRDDALIPQSASQTSLGMRRRRLFHNYEFLVFVFNTVSGVVSYILRFVLSSILVLITFSRYVIYTITRSDRQVFNK